MNANAGTVERLMAAFRDDGETIRAIENALLVFEKYHRAIIELEIQRRLYAAGAMAADEYREQIPLLDRTRTVTHNALLTQVRLLNTLAGEIGAEPFYPGAVSEAYPCRREVADAVLDYVETLIRERS